MPSRTNAVSLAAPHASVIQSYGMLSTFPPTACGIATFSAALAAGLVANGATVDVVRCGAGGEIEDPLVSAVLDEGGPDRFAAAVDVLDDTDVAIVQHEYGIYGGIDGDEVVTVLEALAVPSIVVAHTVLRHPTSSQREVLEHACAAAGAVVVMTESARNRLIEGFDVADSKIAVIPHGATTPGVDGAPDIAPRRQGRPARLLTWGLLGPGKGIEWAIDAMASLSDLRPRPHLYRRRGHPSQGAGPRWRGLPTNARRPVPERRRRGVGVVRRHLPRPREPDPTDRFGRCRRAALRL